MIRQSYNLGGHQYVVDIYDVNKDLKNDIYYRNFIMIRNFDIVNNIISDNDIYIIQKETYDKFIKSIYHGDSNASTTDQIVFPVPGSSITTYSSLYTDFNNNFKDYSLFYNYDEETDSYELGTDAYQLFDSDGNVANIKCNLVKIYHPVTQKKFNGIVHIDSYINNIHFHFLCQLYKNFDYSSETEFKYNNQLYSEYIEILFPNLHELFKYTKDENGKEIFNVYFNENLNNVYSAKNENFISRISTRKKENLLNYLSHVIDKESYIDNSLQNQLVPINLITQPYRIIEEENPITKEMQNVKLYIKQYKNIENNYITYSYNITLFPTDGVDENNYMYLIDKEVNFLTKTFFDECKFSLIAETGFNNGAFSILTKFDYPDKENWLKAYDNNSQQALLNAYKFYYDIDQYDYDYFWVKLLRIKQPEMEPSLIEYVETHWDEQYESNTHFDDDDNAGRYKFKQLVYNEETGEEEWESVDDLTDDEILRRAIKANVFGVFDNLRDEEIEEEFRTSLDFIGYQIEISTDKVFKNVIYDTTFVSSLNKIDDFSFDISNIFNNWDEITEFVMCRVSFIDHIVGLKIISNVLVLDIDELKYMVVKDVNSILQLNKLNNDMKEINISENNIKNQIVQIKDDFDNNLDREKNNIMDELNDATNLTIQDVKQKILDIYNLFKVEFDLQTQNILNSDITPINFIDSINIITTKENIDTNPVNINNYGSKVIFKPMFYRSNDAQNIKLRSNVNQNIGINLNEYMTKVETFKLRINDIEYIESGRNDIYVIFLINSTIITTSSGKYDIFNQDDEYITSGNYILI